MKKHKTMQVIIILLFFKDHFSFFVLEYLLYNALFRVTGLDTTNVKSHLMTG